MPAVADTGQVVVRYRAASQPAARTTASDTVDATGRRSLPFVRGAELLQLPAGADPRAAAARLERDPAVLYAEPEIVYHGAAVPNDPLYAQQWALPDVAAPAAWDLETGGPGTLVAVVDSGVAGGHFDLAPNLWTNPGETGSGREANGADDDGDGLVDDWRGWDWIDDDNDPADAMGHGTHVAGIIAARGNDAAGMAGLAWHSRILPLRVLDDHDAGSSVDIAAAFAYAARAGARVVNASILGAPSQLVEDVVRAHPEVLFVAAAGNSGADIAGAPTYPCSLPYENVVCVAATDQQDQLASFSNYGPSRVDIAAPGVDVLSTQPGLRTVVADDFEGATHPFSAGWGVTDEHASSGTHAFADSPHADYANGTTTASEATFDASGLSGCRVEYRLWLDLADSGDRFQLIGTDQQTGAQDVVGTVVGPAHVDAAYRHGFLLDLQHTSRLRLELTSNGSGRAAGADIDDVRLRCIDPALTPAAGDYDRFSGTSMAAPMVAGAAALAFSRNPAMTPGGVRDALLGGAVRSAALDGRVESGRLDARATLDRIPPTAPPAAGPTMPSTAPAPPGSSATAGAPDAGASSVSTVRRPTLARRHIALLITGRRTRRGLRLSRLVLLAPRAAGAVATCQGRHCPFKRRTLSREAAGDVLGADVQRRVTTRPALLPSGTTLVVTITRGRARVRLTLRTGARGAHRITRACATSPSAALARCPS